MRRRLSISSPRLAAILMGSLSVLALVSVVVPQSVTAGPASLAGWPASQAWLAQPLHALGLDRVFSSWPYWLVSGLLFANLATCTFQRIRRRRMHSRDLPAPPERGYERVAVDGGLDGAESALRTRLRDLKVVRSESGIVCRSGDVGFAGSVGMHIGLLVLVLAGVATGLTRFEGALLLTEGQTVRDVRSSYLDVHMLPRIGDPFTGHSLRLDALKFVYAGTTVTDASAMFTVDSQGAARHAVARVNEPLRVDGSAFLLMGAGYAVSLRVTDPGGARVMDAFLNLGETTPEGSADAVVVGDLHLGLLAKPGPGAVPGREAEQRLNPTDPVVVISAKAGDRGSVTTRTLRPGGAMMCDGWRIEVGEVRRWNRFDVRRDGGLPLLCVGAALVLIGTAVRMFDPERTVWLRPLGTADDDGGTQLAVWGRARWGSALASRAARNVTAALREPRSSSDSAGEERA